MRILEGKSSRITPKQSEDGFLWLLIGVVTLAVLLLMIGGA